MHLSQCGLYLPLLACQQIPFAHGIFLAHHEHSLFQKNFTSLLSIFANQLVNFLLLFTNGIKKETSRISVYIFNVLLRQLTH